MLCHFLIIILLQRINIYGLPSKFYLYKTNGDSKPKGDNTTNGKKNYQTLHTLR